jgi:hypothetical protein
MDTITRIEGREAFQGAVRDALAEAAAAGWREIWLCDPDFANWPLGERSVIENLTQWANSRRRLTVLALQYDEVLRRHPRWVHWRQQWAHVVHCRALQDLQANDVPVMLHATGGLTLRQFDPLRYLGTLSRDAADGVRAREEIDVISQRSIEAFPATTIGL